jgi:hypothetical protein
MVPIDEPHIVRLTSPLRATPAEDAIQPVVNQRPAK